jgi:hypothetical protein
MPYIRPCPARQIADNELDGLPNGPGELNYLITKLCLDYLGTESYSKYNEVIGVLECAKLEMYRRAVAPYEDKKIAENGDVY